MRRHTLTAVALMVLLAACSSAAPVAAATASAAEGGQQAARRMLQLSTAVDMAAARQASRRTALANFLAGVVNFIKGPAAKGPPAPAPQGAPQHQVAAAQGPPQVTAAQGPAQPSAGAVQLVQLPPPPPSSGIILGTSTPVNVGSPIDVETPVEQVNLQGALGRR